MTHDELVEEYCESNGYEICPLADSPDQICRNPNHCEQCEAEYAEWLDSKEKQTAELAGQLDCGDISGNYDKCKLVDSIAEQVINFGYRKADEVRKETAQEILNYLVKSTVIRTAPDTIKMFFRVNYGVEVDEDKT